MCKKIALINYFHAFLQGWPFAVGGSPGLHSGKFDMSPGCPCPGCCNSELIESIGTFELALARLKYPPSDSSNPP